MLCRAVMADPMLMSPFQSPTLRREAYYVAICALLISSLCGCTSLRDYVHNGFKVGPNYARPAAPVAQDWIDANDVRVKKDEIDPCQWWDVFHDPILDDLICTAYHQNLTLREAGFRILQARAQLGITIGSVFPQTQNASGNYMRIANSQATSAGGNFGTQFSNQWNFGFNLAWELDFWGRFRRAVEADSDLLNASVEDYDAALVTLLGDVASNYAQMRTLEQRITYAQNNVRIQKDTLAIVEARFKASTISELDLDQARTTVAATEAAISELQIGLRQTIVQLCVLMGMPPEDLLNRIGTGPIPVTPKEVAVGIPADLLRRRPDVREAERRLAAQCAEIGIADSEFYPHISIDGTLGWRAQDLNHLFESRALNGNVGPSFTWNLLNYGRLLNDVRLQDARFQELIATYQNTVLLANQDVENGLITFLKSQERTALQQYAVDQAVRAVDLAVKQYRAGTTDFTTVTQVQQIQVQQQDLLAQAQGEIAAGLIQVYRALGGGWQIRLQGCNASLPPPGAAATVPQSMPSPEAVPTPLPNSPHELPRPALPWSPPNQVPSVPQPLQPPTSSSSALPTVQPIPLISLTSAGMPAAPAIPLSSMDTSQLPAAPATISQLPSVVAPSAPTNGGSITVPQITPVVAPPL
jgi:NodT family efflux transporter outer membrane factor (OMF) lipoprotein